MDELKYYKHERTNRMAIKKRLLMISILAVLLAAATAFAGRLLIYLIDFFTNITFHGSFFFHTHQPGIKQFGESLSSQFRHFGGLAVGLLARYGSKAIRGHGIPGGHGANINKPK